jgi:DNA-directed RNA polymerase sigma subunit (sigma70/sigma32)
METTPEAVYEAVELQRLVDELLETLPAREARVVCWVYGIGGERCLLGEIGQRLGVGRARARQVLARALRRFRRGRRWAKVRVYRQ